MDYIIDSTGLFQQMREVGINSLAELAERSSVHRNTVYPLVRGERSVFNESFISICNAIGSDPRSIIVPSVGKHFPVVSNIARECAERFLSAHQTLAIFLFGSRASKSARQFSDYDVGLTGGENKLTGKDFLRIKEFILERTDDLPVKVDVVNFDGAPESFVLDFESQILPLAGHIESIYFLKGIIHATQENTKTR